MIDLSLSCYNEKKCYWCDIALKINKIKKISEVANVSESTVKRALGNCPGVNSKTRKKVLGIANELGFSSREVKADVAVVIPSSPSFFWGRLVKALSSSLNTYGLNYKFFRFTSTSNEDDALFCIDTAVKSKISVMILSVPNTEKIRKKINEISNSVHIILVEELVDADNVCYIGENSFEAGYSLARKYFNKFPESKSIVICDDKLSSCGKRIDGFLKAAEELGIDDIKYVSTSTGSPTKAQSAIVARRLIEYIDTVHCIYCPSGTLSTINHALSKLSPERDIHIIGFENHTRLNYTNRVDMLKLVIDQNLEQQASIAVRVAAECLENGRLPDIRTIYTPSTTVIDCK